MVHLASTLIVPQKEKVKTLASVILVLLFSQPWGL